MSKVKYKMSNVNKVKLLSERTSGVPPVIFFGEGPIKDKLLKGGTQLHGKTHGTQRV